MVQPQGLAVLGVMYEVRGLDIQLILPVYILIFGYKLSPEPFITNFLFYLQT